MCELNHGIDDVKECCITDEEAAEIIEGAAKADAYKASPITDEMARELTPDIESFVSISYQHKSRLSALYASPTSYLSLFAKDWELAHQQGALRMYDEATISFPTRIQKVNGDALEVSIARNSRGNGLPWFLKYVPPVEKLRLKRDCIEDATSASDSPKDPLPPLLEAEFDEMAQLGDYTGGHIPDEILQELSNQGKPFDEFVGIPPHWEDRIVEFAKKNIDPVALLNRDWEYALSTRTLRYYKGKVLFPLSILRDDGVTLVEAIIRQDRDPRQTRVDAMVPHLLVS